MGSRSLRKAACLTAVGVSLVCAGCLPGLDPMRYAPAKPSAPFSPDADDIQPPGPRAVVLLPPTNRDQEEGLSLGQLLGTALEINPSTRAMWQRAREAAAEYGQAEGTWYPSIEAQFAGARQSGQISSNSGAGGSSVATRPTWVTNFGGSLTILLLDFGGRLASQESARQALLSANWMHDQSLQNLVLDVATAYYKHVGALAQFDAAEASLTDALKSLRAAERRKMSGVATIADVLQARATEANAVLRVEQARGAVETTRGTLATRVGWDADTRFKVTTENLEIPAETVSASVEDLIELARENRPSLAATRADVLARQADVDVAFSRALPILGARALVDRYHIDRAVRSEATSYAMGVGVEAPIFTGFQNLNAIRAAEAQLAAEQDELEAREQEIIDHVFTAYWNFRTATRSLEASIALESASEQNHRVSLGRYKTGAGDILELLNAQRLLADARYQLVRARTELLTSYAVMLNAIGEDLPVLPTPLRREAGSANRNPQERPDDA